MSIYGQADPPGPVDLGSYRETFYYHEQHDARGIESTSSRSISVQISICRLVCSGVIDSYAELVTGRCKAKEGVNRPHPISGFDL